MHSPSNPFDAVVIGGGPAGLSAALWLARYRRRVRVYDADNARNRPARVVHGFPGLAGVSPERLRHRIREQAVGAGAEIVDAAVHGLTGEKDAFRIETEAGTAEARRILLAFGRHDRLPRIPGLADLYGTSVFHCPDCDGPGVAESRVGVLGHDRAAATVALHLTVWASGVVLLTHGREPDLDERARAVLSDAGIPIRLERVLRLEPRDGRLARVRLETDATLALDALFFHIGTVPATGLAGDLGCRATRDGHVHTDAAQQTSVAGVYAAGDLVGHPHLAADAAATGVRAALGIHRSLLPDAFDLL